MFTRHTYSNVLKAGVLSAITTTSLVFAAPARADDVDYAIKHGGNAATRAATRLLKKGEARDAAGIYLGVLKKGGRDALMKIAHTNLCASYSMLGMYDNAIQSCSTALEMDETYWEALVNRGNAHFLAGNKAAALKDFQTAQKTEPSEKIITRAIAAVEENTLGSGAL